MLLMADPQPATPFPLRLWYLQCFVRTLVMIFPTYLIMMQDSGIGNLGLATLLVIWSLSAFLFEVPTGVIADLLPRRTVLIVSGFVQAGGFTCWLVWPDFLGYAVGFVVWSLGNALYSGTFQAYIYESLHRPEDFDKPYGRTEAAHGIGIATALFCGGYLAEGGYTLPLILSIAAPFVAIGAMCLLPHSPPLAPAGREAHETSFRTVLVSGLKTTWRTPLVLTLVLISGSMVALPGTFEEYLGVLLTERQFSLTDVGLVYGGVWTARTLGNLAAGRLSGQPLHTPLAIFAIVSAATLAALLAAPELLVVGLLAFYAMDGLFSVFLTSRLQQAVDDHHRATITSVMSMVTEGFAVLYFYALAMAAARSSWFFSLHFMVATGVCLALLWIWRSRKL